MSPFEA
jgi:hypothetical protein